VRSRARPGATRRACVAHAHAPGLVAALGNQKPHQGRALEDAGLQHTMSAIWGTAEMALSPALPVLARAEASVPLRQLEKGGARDIRTLEASLGQCGVGQAAQVFVAMRD
jgi:hypothetical protein